MFEIGRYILDHELKNVHNDYVTSLTKCRGSWVVGNSRGSWVWVWVKVVGNKIKKKIEN